MDEQRPRLVFGDDSSPDADVTWTWIDNHRWSGWRISVVTAQPPPVGPPVGAERATPHPWQPPAPRVLSDQDGSTELEHLMAEADPRLVLDGCTDAALTAVGPRGQGLLKHLHLGSTTEWLISGLRPLTPVVVVRSGDPCERILLCDHPTHHPHNPPHTHARLPWIGDTSVTILGVRAGEQEADRGAQEAAEILAACRVKLLLLDAIPETVSFGVRSSIFATMDNEQPNLVAMGTRGISGLRRVVLGSTASAVVRHAPCSVLVARVAEQLVT
jgi:nucleotide-binding universal stress UspA family protein